METIIGFVTSYLAANQIAGGGAVLMILGAVLAYARLVPEYVWLVLKRWFVYTIEISSSDLVFAGVTSWLESNDVSSKCHSFKAISLRFDAGNPYGNSSKNHNKTSLTNSKITKKLGLLLKPLNELRWFWLDGNLVFFYTYREKFEQAGEQYNSSTEDGTYVPKSGEMYYETYVFSSWFNSGRKAIVKILEESAKAVSTSVEDRLEIKLLKIGYDSASWDAIDTKPKRYLSSVALDESQKQEILEDAKLFFNSKDWYEKVGLPWRRGYLLYGPPGNGKSTLVTALASELDRPIYVMNLSDLKSDIGALDAFNSVPEGSFILLEEVDTAFTKERDKRGSGVSDFSFSGLLNSLDGVAGQSGSIIVMTTNHIDKIDPALIRPGRADKKIMFGNCSKQQLIVMIDKLKPDLDEKIKSELINKYIPESLSVAQVQESLLGANPLDMINLCKQETKKSKK